MIATSTSASHSRPIRVAPSLLSADFSDLRRACAVVEEAGAEILHLDVMDGRFVPNLTFGPLVVEAVRRSTRLFLDVHLMIVEPQGLLGAFAKAGADRLTVHAEVCPHLQSTLQAIHDLGVEAGVALNPATPEDAVEYVWDDADLILAMTVNPGFGGQAFLPAVLPKIRRLRRTAQERGWPGHIEVDGGIGEQTVSLVVAAGADLLVAGSAIYGQPSPGEAFRRLQHLAEESAQA